MHEMQRSPTRTIRLLKCFFTFRQKKKQVIFMKREKESLIQLCMTNKVTMLIIPVTVTKMVSSRRAVKISCYRNMIE